MVKDDYSRFRQLMHDAMAYWDIKHFLSEHDIQTKINQYWRGLARFEFDEVGKAFTDLMGDSTRPREFPLIGTLSAMARKGKPVEAREWGYKEESQFFTAAFTYLFPSMGVMIWSSYRGNKKLEKIGDAFMDEETVRQEIRERWPDVEEYCVTNYQHILNRREADQTDRERS